MKNEVRFQFLLSHLNSFFYLPGISSNRIKKPIDTKSHLFFRTRYFLCQHNNTRKTEFVLTGVCLQIPISGKRRKLN
jgi:hypothetical protein